MSGSLLLRRDNNEQHWNTVKRFRKLRRNLQGLRIKEPTLGSKIGSYVEFTYYEDI